MKRRRFKSFPDRQCLDCGGSGFRSGIGNSVILGTPMEGVNKCHCWTVIDLRKPKKAKKEIYDGRAAAYVD